MTVAINAKGVIFFSKELQPHSHMNPLKKNISLLNLLNNKETELGMIIIMMFS